ncbi:hypothetical protein PGTUg99_030795 [Puccinia graminis f. sp. tritici]|uniref:Uncharacterized protein n=1 Tax=Puccinia graminis f. sp. tritici TaxID=56615 RepID=A0A5B0SLA2_PUCGR|nr:hypothetical protein PGTUg99_030795 [Puccinia graminis f. sp. tritici]
MMELSLTREAKAVILVHLKKPTLRPKNLHPILKQRKGKENARLIKKNVGFAQLRAPCVHYPDFLALLTAGLMVRRDTRRFRPFPTRRSWRLRRPVYIDLEREDTPEPRAGAPHDAGRHISEPVVVERAHEELMAAGQLPVANPNIQPPKSPTNTTRANSNLAVNLPGSLAPPNADSNSNHLHVFEGNNPRRMPPAPTLAQPNANPFVARVPFPPARAAMEAVAMETYLNIAHIPRDDLRTRSRLLVHGIGHWTFFRATNEAELT